MQAKTVTTLAPFIFKIRLSTSGRRKKLENQPLMDRLGRCDRSHPIHHRSPARDDRKFAINDRFGDFLTELERFDFEFMCLFNFLKEGKGNF